MLDAFRYELVRLRSVRSTWVLVAAALVMQFGVAFLWAGHSDMTPLNRFVYSFDFLQLQLLLLCVAAVAVNAFGHEYRFRTITTTVLTLRSRPRVLVAKAVTTMALAAVTGAAAVGVTLLAEALRGGVPAEWSRVGEVLGAVVVYTMLSALFGLGVAALIRNATVSMVLVIAVPNVVEVLLLLAHVSPRVLPFHAAAALVPLPADAVAWALPLPLVALATVLVAAAGVLLVRRDV